MFQLSRLSNIRVSEVLASASALKLSSLHSNHRASVFLSVVKVVYQHSVWFLSTYFQNQTIAALYAL